MIDLAAAPLSDLCSELARRIREMRGPEQLTDELRSLAGLIRMKQRTINAGGRPIKRTRSKATAEQRAKWRDAQRKRRERAP